MEAARLSITPHIKAYHTSKVWEQRITEQILKERPGSRTRLLPKKYWMSKGIQSPPLESTYLTGHSKAEPALQLSLQFGTDARASLSPLPGFHLDVLLVQPNKQKNKQPWTPSRRRCRCSSSTRRMPWTELSRLSQTRKQQRTEANRSAEFFFFFFFLFFFFVFSGIPVAL